MRTPIVLVVIALASCSSSHSASSPVVAAGPSSSYSLSRGDWSSQQPDPSTLDRSAFFVAPDRAVVRIDASVDLENRTAAIDRLREVVAALGHASREHCSISEWAYEATTPSGGSFLAQASVRVDIELAGLDSANARHRRMEDCLGVIHDLDPARFQGAELRMSAPLLMVDDPGRYRTELLERRFAPLRQVAALSNVPAQFRAPELHCTSTGEVSVVTRSLQGVALEVDFNCSPRVNQAQPLPESTEG